MPYVRSLVVAAICLLLGAAGVAAQEIDPGVDEAIAEQGSAPVIVLLRSLVSPTAPLEELQTAVFEVQERVLGAVGPVDFAVVHRYESLAALAGMLTAQGLAVLAAHPDVERIGLSLPGAGDQLVTYIPFLGADVLHTAFGITGAGTIVVVIDSGVDRNHVALAGSVIGERCWCTRLGQTGVGCCPNGSPIAAGTGSAFDDHGHGTHITGIIRSTGAATAPVGMAPAAQIIALKVLDSQNTFQTSWDVIAALDWVATYRPDADAVNMSLGSTALYQGTCDALSTQNVAYANVIATLTANGTVVSASSGNAGSSTSMAAPACISGAIAVGATGLQDTVASFSNSSTALDFLAPGSHVHSTLPGLFNTGLMTGTSQATAHVTGAVALLREAFPMLDVAQIYDALTLGGVPKLDSRNGIVVPRINALDAYLAPICGNGRTDGAEQCDDGNATNGDGCDVNCTTSTCGNGIAAGAELCDDGNAINGDGCDNNCTPTGCGNGIATAGEQCDDGNATNGDGCDVNCTTSTCGNGIAAGGEQCDEGPLNGYGGCCIANSCTYLDVDGDGTCDRDDPCPNLAFASPAPLVSIKRVDLKYKATGPGHLDDAPKVTRAQFVSAAPFDPSTTDTLRIQMVALLRASRVFKTQMRAGPLWSGPPAGRLRWRYVDRSRPAGDGVGKALIKERPRGSGSFVFTMVGRDNTLLPPAVPLSPGTDVLRLSLEIESGGTGQCFETVLATCTRPRANVDRCTP